MAEAYPSSAVHENVSRDAAYFVSAGNAAVSIDPTGKGKPESFQVLPRRLFSVLQVYAYKEDISVFVPLINSPQTWGFLYAGWSPGSHEVKHSRSCRSLWKSEFAPS